MKILNLEDLLQAFQADILLTLSLEKSVEKIVCAVMAIPG